MIPSPYLTLHNETLSQAISSTTDNEELTDVIDQSPPYTYYTALMIERLVRYIMRNKANSRPKMVYPTTSTHLVLSSAMDFLITISYNFILVYMSKCSKKEHARHPSYTLYWGHLHFYEP